LDKLNKNIGIFSFGRKQSQRCPNKMLRPFSDTTLTDIILSKLSFFNERAFFAGYESEFKEKSERHGVRFVQRDFNSVNIDGPITDVLAFLKKVEFEYFLIINGCLPFLTVQSINSFLVECEENNYDSAFAVILRNNFFISLDREPLNFDLNMKSINTKEVKPVYEFAHALYFFNKDYFFKHGRYWDWNDVKLVELKDRYELMDIDTEDDFEITEQVWNARKKLNNK
jgi:CMP-N-acetylneuraminic acid synthetase